VKRRPSDSVRYLALANDPLKTDPAFCSLSLHLQGLELALRRDGTRSTCGVHPVRLRPWTRLAPGLTRDDVERGLLALADAGRCSVDWDEEEVYWVGYVTQQPGIASYRYAKGVLAAVADIQSPLIRAGVVAEMATIPLSSVAVAPSDDRYKGPAEAVRAAWEAVVASAVPASEGVSEGVSEPEHSPQDSEHSTQDTGSRKGAVIVQRDVAAPAQSVVRDAAALTSAWWQEHGRAQATAKAKVEKAVVAALATGSTPNAVYEALTFVATVERRGITEGTLRVGLGKVAQQQVGQRSVFLTDAQRLADAAALLEGSQA
jgi:hypothetical protein